MKIDISKKLTDQLYHFSFALLPDELQAKQLIIDALALVDEHEVKELSEYNGNIPASFLKKIYGIAFKRWPQIKDSLAIGIKDTEAMYFQLAIEMRAITFLKHIWKTSNLDIAEIISQDIKIIPAQISYARRELLEWSASLDI